MRRNLSKPRRAPIFPLSVPEFFIVAAMLIAFLVVLVVVVVLTIGGYKIADKSGMPELLTSISERVESTHE